MGSLLAKPPRAFNIAAEPITANVNGAADAQPTALTPAEELFATVRSLIERLPVAKTEAEIADELNVSKAQVKEWLARLVETGVVEKTARPVRYRPASERPVQGSLFG